MSKFLFIFCAFLLAAGSVYGEEVGKVMQMKNEVVDAAETAIKNLETKLNEYSEPIKKLISTLQTKATNLRSSVYNQIVNVEQEVLPKIDKVISDAAGSDVEECKKMATSVKPIASETFKESTQCMTDLVDKAVNTWNNIFKESQEALDNLFQVKKEATVCVKNIDTWQSATSASYCVTKVAAVGTWETVTNVPAIILEITNLYWQIQTFAPQLKACAVQKGVQKVKETSEGVLKNVVTCVKAKISEKTGKSEKSWVRSLISW
ncbi:uncharacterized protein LOC127277538 [Leptopilina boulardi]|uniref:uncharacterized protein LOC127277538 n=1 Tax=Leptopilina boulardi TaxID=63433 RepID=UPI0021F5E087|nr:uncharacterized protein LOC127277538 [Leptopilina boulardi]